MSRAPSSKSELSPIEMGDEGDQQTAGGGETSGGGNVDNIPPPPPPVQGPQRAGQITLAASRIVKRGVHHLGDN